MEKKVYRTPETEEIWTELERIYFEKIALEQFMVFMDVNHIDCDLTNYCSKYIQALSDYEKIKQKFETFIILPSTDNKGGAWSVNFAEQCVTITDSKET